MRSPTMSGHCSTPSTANPEESHARCARHGAGSSANPDKEFMPCPCRCHLGEEYECGNCGRIIRETVLWLGDGVSPTYVHVDKTGRATSEDCP